MVQTLQEVLEHGSEFVAKLDKVVLGMSSLTSCRSSRIDGVLVLPDEVLKRYYEMVYVFNTHFAPSGLPGVGMAIGDFLVHQEKMYLTVNLGVCLGNMEALQLFRRYEAKFRVWEAKRDEFDTKVKEFIAALDRITKMRLGLDPLLKADEWHDTSAGWQYVGTPNPRFVDVLATVAIKLRKLKKKGVAAVARMASTLEAELRQFSTGVEEMQDIREKVKHRGVPFIDGDVVAFTSPTASGGASLHNKNAHDDLMRAIPNQSDFMMVAGQCEVGNIVHIGGGNVQGENFVMLLPRTPFFKMVQERLTGNESLSEAWQLLANEEDATKAMMNWFELTKPLKNEVIKQVVPELVAHRVLGFSMNLTDEPGTALLRPIVAESMLAGNEDVIVTHNLRVIRKNVETVLGEAGDGYGKVPSVFDETAA